MLTAIADEFGFRETSMRSSFSGHDSRERMADLGAESVVCSGWVWKM